MIVARASVKNQISSSKRRREVAADTKDVICVSRRYNTVRAQPAQLLMFAVCMHGKFDPHARQRHQAAAVQASSLVAIKPEIITERTAATPEKKNYSSSMGRTAFSSSSSSLLSLSRASE